MKQIADTKTIPLTFSHNAEKLLKQDGADEKNTAQNCAVLR
ncbi:hypothetical protein [uncultured Neisseria sp.]|nr:hypothetical protein [uncultured Neisseria sp.]